MQLAHLHHVTTSSLDLSFLPKQAPQLEARLQPPPQLDESMQEAEIRATLAPFASSLSTSWSISQDERLLHGDFWPGNLLWHEGELAGVIDWEDAATGNPLEDFQCVTQARLILKDGVRQDRLDA